jgi:hypothetical protein
MKLKVNVDGRKKVTTSSLSKLKTGTKREVKYYVNQSHLKVDWDANESKIIFHDYSVKHVRILKTGKYLGGNKQTCSIDVNELLSNLGKLRIQTELKVCTDPADN